MCPSVCMNLDISYRYGIEFGRLGKLCIVSEAMFQKGDSIDRAITASLNKFYSIIIFLRKPSLHLVSNCHSSDARLQDTQISPDKLLLTGSSWKALKIDRLQGKKRKRKGRKELRGSD